MATVTYYTYVLLPLFARAKMATVTYYTYVLYSYMHDAWAEMATDTYDTIFIFRAGGGNGGYTPQASLDDHDF